MAKTWATKCCSGTYKNNYQLCCGIKVSEIPSLFITDMYPLSMHAVAIYGKILGEPANYLITQLIPDSNGESEETTTYTYTLDNRGIVTSCHAVVRHIRNGYEQDYTRTVNYTIE